MIDPSKASYTKPKYILITNGNSFVGYTAAIYIAEQLEKYKPHKKHWKVKVLCENKSQLKDLEKRGIEVHEVDYSSSYMLSEQMKEKIKVVVFVPCVESGNLMEQGRNLIDCAVKHNIKRVVMVSLIGCQLSKKEGPLRDYHKLEKHMENEYKFGYWTIFRIPFIQQFFYFWASMVENGILGLPLSKSDLLYDVNIQDVCECLAQVSMSKKHAVWAALHDESSQDSLSVIRRVYDLRCGPLSFEMIVSELSAALQEFEGGPKVKAITLTDDQFKRYLEYMANQNKQQGLQEILQDIRMNHDKEASSSDACLTSLGHVSTYDPSTMIDHKDNPSFIPNPSKVITPFFIDLMMDSMRIIRANQPLSIIPNQDIRDLTGKEPIHIGKFFVSNLRQFRPRD